jgi:two-component system heavy metal sensor histidine kinase CusS
VGRIAKVLIGVGIGGTLLGLLLLVGVVRFALAPVRALADAIAAVKEDTLTVSFAATTTPQELRPIVVRLDDLIRRLAKAFARERELTAEVAHELRTPLSGLRVTLELALARDRAAERYRTALVDCLAITKQTESVVQTLLSLARLDAGVTKLRRTRVELDDMVGETLVVIAARAEERKIAITTSLPAFAVEADVDMLRLVVQNLLDNAVSYCDEGGSVDVTLRPGELRVSNTGCTLDEQDLAHIFERFWRKDAARSAGHSGLGLALCRQIMDALGGTIAVEVGNGRFVATVTMPT